MVMAATCPGESNPLKGSVAVTRIKKGQITRQQLAANPTYKQALSAFQVKNYAVALQDFQKLDSSGYCCDMVHYYIAQCYQNTNQTIAASQHYNWVSERSSDPTLRAYADYANQTMAYYNAHRTYAGQGNNFSHGRGSSAGGASAVGGERIGFG